MPKFGGTVLYVADVESSIAFWQKAFGLSRGFVSPTGEYGTVGELHGVGFAGEKFVEKTIPGFATNRASKPTAGFEVVLYADDVDAAYRKAIEAGCKVCSEPADKPWGQRVSYVYELNGVLVEICSPWAPPS